MGLIWRFKQRLAASGMAHAEFEAISGLAIGPDWLGPVPPRGLSLEGLAQICEALGAQPGELLAWEADAPGAIAERNLAGDLFYQSLLAHRESQRDADEEAD